MISKKRRRNPRLGCRFYRSDTGAEPVSEWLRSLESETRKEIGSDLQVVQWRFPIGKPLVDGFGDGLFELRTSSGGNTYRVLFCVQTSTIILLHGFMKKTQKTPKADLDLARDRKKKLEKEK